KHQTDQSWTNVASKQKPRTRPGFLSTINRSRGELTLAELFAATCFVQTDFLTLNSTSVASHQASLLQFCLQCCVVVDQSAGDAVTGSTGLAAFAAAMHVDLDVERFNMVGQHQRLTHNHATRFTSKVFVNRLAVDYDLTRTLLDEDTSNGGLATARTVIPVTNHDLSLDVQSFRLLSTVRMLGTSVNLQFLGHGVAQRAFWQHTLDGLFDGTAWEALLHGLEVGFVNTAWVVRVTIVLLILRLVTGHGNVSSVD